MPDTVLLVDDDPKFRASIAPIWENRGYKVAEAALAREALVELKLSPVSLAIVDGQLPEESGVWLIEQIRRSGSHPDIKIMFVSAGWRDAESYLHLTKSLGVSIVVHKPVPPSVLLEHAERLVGVTTQQSPKEALAAKLAEAAAEYAVELVPAIEEIQSVADLCRSEFVDTSEFLKKARRQAHMLRGTAGSYGFARISMLMGVVEDVLSRIEEKKVPLWRTEGWPRVDEAIQEALYEARIHSNVSSLTRRKETAEETAAYRGRILVVGADIHVKARLATLAPAFQINHANLNDAIEASHDTDGAIIQLPQESDPEPFFDLVRGLCPPGKRRTPVSVIGTPSSCDEATALYLRLHSLIKMPVAQSDLTAFANESIASKATQKVLVIDDDVQFIKRIEVILNYENIGVNGFPETERAMELIDQLQPDLLILDADMPGISGFDIARMVRNSEKWCRLPIIFVTALTSWQSRVAAFESGADDYLAKPVVTAELLARLRTWLERSHRKSDRFHDTITGLPIHSIFVERLQQLEGRGAFALIELVNLAELNKSLGAEAGDRVLLEAAHLLRARFRETDKRGRWSGRKLAIGCEEVTRQTLEAAVHHFIAELKNRAAELFSRRAHVPPLEVRCACFEWSPGDSIYDLLRHNDASRNLAGKQPG